jgi:hypothetical protein
MQALDVEVLKSEPDMRFCTTERITSELYRCSINNKACKYGIFAGKTCTYCMHPDHLKYLKSSNMKQKHSK